MLKELIAEKNRLKKLIEEIDSKILEIKEEDIPKNIMGVNEYKDLYKLYDDIYTKSIFDYNIKFNVEIVFDINFEKEEISYEIYGGWTYIDDDNIEKEFLESIRTKKYLKNVVDSKLKKVKEFNKFLKFVCDKYGFDPDDVLFVLSEE